MFFVCLVLYNTVEIDIFNIVVHLSSLIRYKFTYDNVIKINIYNVIIQNSIRINY